MDSILVTQLIEEALANVNVSVVVALMAIGFIIKHVKFLDKISSDVIPPTLLLCSIVSLDERKTLVRKQFCKGEQERYL